MAGRRAVHRFLHRVLHHTEFGFWIGVGLVVFAVVANLLMLTLNLMFLYAHPDVQPEGVDPVTGSMVGLALVLLVVYLLKGVRRKRMWPAVGLVVSMPLMYVVMADGLAAAMTQQPAYFAAHWRESLAIELTPACVLALVYGAQALGVARERVRRLR